MEMAENKMESGSNQAGLQRLIAAGPEESGGFNLLGLYGNQQLSIDVSNLGFSHPLTSFRQKLIAATPEEIAVFISEG
ncbi:hypothetical protein ACH5RR_024862 [Cinchona calisaya]|uniref:Uncharacterized protein n=1 Tax=Cinchona calisaya TaxID=153742 RepID=A0ABD2Z1D0_9GENT